VGAVHADPGVTLATAAPAHADVDQARAAGAHAECVGGAVMAQERLISERKHRRPPPRVDTEHPMIDREHTSMQPMQPSTAHAAVDRLP
jgi:hypothetical protein